MTVLYNPICPVKMFQFCEQLITQVTAQRQHPQVFPDESSLTVKAHVLLLHWTSSLNLTCLLIYIRVVYLFISSWFPVLIHKMTSLWRKKTCVVLVHCYWESQFLGRLLRSPGSPRRRKGSGALKVEIGVWNSQGRGKDKLLFFVYIPSKLKLSHSVVSDSLQPHGL